MKMLGTKVLEIDATHVIVKALQELQSATPPDHDVVLEFEVQHPSSNFYLDFLGGIVNVCLYTSLLSPVSSPAGLQQHHQCRRQGKLERETGSSKRVTGDSDQCPLRHSKWKHWCV
jgi:hypothetical protein